MNCSIVRRSVVAFFLVVAPAIAGGKAVAARVGVDVFKCTEPVASPCVATSELDKAKCSSCHSWTSARLDQPVSGVLEDRKYPGAQNNYFLRDTSQALYKVAYPVTSEGKPVRVRDLAANPAKYNWVEVPPGQSKEGTIAVRGGIAAVVNGGSPGEPEGTVRLASLPAVHASAALQGKVTQTRLGDLFGGKPAKFLLPQEFLSKLRSLLWNTWFEEAPEGALPGPTFNPVMPGSLEPGSSYRVVFDLSALAYPNSSSSTVGRSFLKTLDLWLATSKVDEAHLTALLLLDPRYFSKSSSQIAPLTLRLAELRAWVAGKTPPPPADPFEALRKAGDSHAPFEFGWVPFPLHTRDKQGKTTIGLVLWDEMGRPLTEVVVPVCIASRESEEELCKGDVAVRQTLSGIDSLRVASGQGAGPDASLVFADFGTLKEGQGVVGVFHRRGWAADRFQSWPLGINADSLGQHLKDIAANFANVSSADRYDEKEAIYQGELLFKELFLADGEERDTPEAKEARGAFLEFVGTHPSSPASASEAPSIFIRVLPSQTLRRPTILPLGIMAVTPRKGPPDMTPRLLGSDFRIEVPLAYQDYTPGKACISRWHLVIPSGSEEESDLYLQRTEMDRDLKEWEEGAEIPKNMSAFRTWMREGKSEKESHALIILSHHGNENDVGKLEFSSKDSMKSTDVNRRFLEPSLAILNGCGSVEPEAEAFVDRFSANGIASIVATKYSVTPELAVNYFLCLSQAIASVDAGSASSRLSLGSLHFAAVRCLANAKVDSHGIPYGARAQAYSLLGNGGLLLCRPVKSGNPGTVQ